MMKIGDKAIYFGTGGRGKTNSEKMDRLVTIRDITWSNENAGFPTLVEISFGNGWLKMVDLKELKGISKEQV